MRIFRVAPIFAALAACATTPHSIVRDTASERLTVCAMKVTNSPSVDSDGFVKGYYPFTEVAGVVLARAPVDACVSSGYGARRGGASDFHYGVDLYTRAPRPVYAAGDGIVELISTQRGYGKTILIRHSNRVKTRYAHLSSFASGLTQGDRVRQGEQIAMTGRTGNATAVHLHYEIRINGSASDPLTIGE